MTELTIDHVAKTAGVSKATVSRVINRSTRVAPDVSRRVQQAIEQIGYQPSARRPGPKPAKRQGIRTGSILLLAVGFPAGDYGMSGYPFLIKGVEKALGEEGLKMMLASLGEDGPLPVALDSSEVDGVLLFGRSDAISAAAESRLVGMPSVCMMRGFDRFKGRLDRVLFNNSAVGPMAAKYLASKGHKQVAFYSIDPSHPAIEARRRDFCRCAAEAGMEVVTLVSPQAPAGLSQEVAAHQAMAEQLAVCATRSTGVFVPMDYWAPYAYQALMRCGIVPGRDLEIVSCDNVALFLDQLSPRPATIDINMSLIGELSVRQLMWRMGNREVKNAVEVMVEPVLVPGA